MSWYALFVETGAEDDVEKFLSYCFDPTECSSCIPKRKLTEKRKGTFLEVTKPLFPGYVLINAKMNSRIYYIIRSIPKVHRFVNQGSEYFSAISDEEMEPILKLVKKNNTIDFSKVIIENSKVYVNSGPLKGLEGLIKKVNRRKSRAKVALNFMGTIKTIDLGIEILET